MTGDDASLPNVQSLDGGGVAMLSMAACIVLLWYGRRKVRKSRM